VWGGLTAALCLFAVLATAATLALAHGGATLTVAPATIAPGGTVTVKADGVEADATFTISLAGAQFKSVLGTVKTTQDTFEQGFTIPANAPADSYQVQALGEDGDVISADLTVSAGAGATSPAESKEPTAALMQLDRSKPVLQTAVIACAALLSIALGIVLLRPRRRAG
jgi:hypothetical protein